MTGSPSSDPNPNRNSRQSSGENLAGSSFPVNTLAEFYRVGFLRIGKSDLVLHPSVGGIDWTPQGPKTLYDVVSGSNVQSGSYSFKSVRVLPAGEVNSLDLSEVNNYLVPAEIPDGAEFDGLLAFLGVEAVFRPDGAKFCSEQEFLIGLTGDSGSCVLAQSILPHLESGSEQSIVKQLAAVKGVVDKREPRVWRWYHTKDPASSYLVMVLDEKREAIERILLYSQVRSVKGAPDLSTLLNSERLKVVPLITSGGEQHGDATLSLSLGEESKLTLVMPRLDVPMCGHHPLDVTDMTLSNGITYPLRTSFSFMLALFTNRYVRDLLPEAKEREFKNLLGEMEVWLKTLQHDRSPTARSITSWGTLLHWLEDHRAEGEALVATIVERSRAKLISRFVREPENVENIFASIGAFGVVGLTHPKIFRCAEHFRSARALLTAWSGWREVSKSVRQSSAELDGDGFDSIMSGIAVGPANLSPLFTMPTKLRAASIEIDVKSCIPLSRIREILQVSLDGTSELEHGQELFQATRNEHLRLRAELRASAPEVMARLKDLPISELVVPPNGLFREGTGLEERFARLVDIAKLLVIVEKSNTAGCSVAGR